MRIGRRVALYGALMLATSGCVGRPGFIPTTRHLYDRFTPLAEPRPSVPVGAMWVDGYGAVGEGATADNTETVRSLSGFTFDADFQASLTLGVLRFLDLDPSMREKVVARFNDLSVIRVKDWNKLTGPSNAPRIYEALKAGTISITTMRSGGLDLENRALSEDAAVVGRGTTGITRTFVIDAKDMVFAIHVARDQAIQSKVGTAFLSVGRPKKIAVGSYDLMLNGHEQPDRPARDCIRQIDYRLARRDGVGGAVSGTASVSAKDIEKLLDLPIPEAENNGKLLSQLRMRWRVTTTGCLARNVTLETVGRAVIRLADPLAPGW